LINSFQCWVESGGRTRPLEIQPIGESMMTRKHYEEIVQILAQHKVSEELLMDLACAFEKDNPRFEVGRFMHRYIALQNALQSEDYVVNQHGEIVEK